MEEPENAPAGNKWYKRLCLIFLFLFGTFWSLGTFFFWVLGGLAAIFGILAFNSSGFSLPSFSLFNRPASPYRSTQGSQTVNPSRPINFVRVAVLVVGGFFILSMLIGVFSSPETEPEPESSTVDNSEPVNDGDVNSLIEKGNDFFSQTQYDSALRYYSRALKIDPSDQYAQYNMALVYFMTKDYRMSIGLIKKCIRAHPDYNEAWWLLGDGYYSTNRNDSAAVALERAYNNGFKAPDFLQLMGDVYRGQNDLPKAKDFYMKVIEQDTTNREVYQQLIDLDPENADAYRKKVKTLSPN